MFINILNLVCIFINKLLNIKLFMHLIQHIIQHYEVI